MSLSAEWQQSISLTDITLNQMADNKIGGLLLQTNIIFNDNPSFGVTN